MRKKGITAVLLASAFATGTLALCACQPQTEAKEVSVENMRIEVRGYEWGPAVPKTIVKFSDNVSGITKDTFEVKSGGAKRVVTDAYACDEAGNKTTAATPYAAVEMSVKYGEANPFTYNQTKKVNEWAAKYAVTVTAKKSFTVGDATCAENEKFTYNVTSAADRLVPQTASWQKDTVNYKEGGKDITLSRASWAPADAATDGGKNPLIIWLHGGGEGGTDIDIALLGNEVTALTTENSTNIQHYFTDATQKGAYVLAVQTPTMWMDALGDGNYGNSEAGGEPDGKPQVSYYTEALWKAITTYVDGNSDIDTDRIYVGGCSNGGYMTMNLALEHGDYFAAYYPICQGYMSGNISDTMLERIKDANIWFLLSEADGTLTPSKYTIPLYNRLMTAGAQNVHLTYKKNVTGVDDPNPTSWTGSGFYDGHWSWIYAFNDDVKTELDTSEVSSIDDITPENCTKAGNMWQWMSEQSLNAVDPDEIPADAEEGYVFEAEHAKITNGTKQDMDQEKVAEAAKTDPTIWQTWWQHPEYYKTVETKPTVETGNEYTTDGSTGEVVTNIGYFSGTGTSLTWNIWAEDECDVTLTLRAAAAVQTNQTQDGFDFAEVDMSQNEYLTMSVNGTAATLTGALPGITGLTWADMQNPAVYRNFGTATVQVHLRKGLNKVVLVTNPQAQSGLNIDKVTASGTTVKLYHVKADNSDRIPQQQPQG